MIGCVLALLLAWTLGWRTGDLIWSMWLASLVIGYALIVWLLFGRLLIGLQQHDSGIALILFGKLFMLAFFTVHFGGFHFGHSIFVNEFFPISPDAANPSSHPGLSDYLEVVKRYAWFLPLALLAQRDMFKWPETHSARDHQRMAAMRAGEQAPPLADGNQDLPPTSAKSNPGADMGAAYKSVVRLHLLIFFLAGTHALQTPEFATFAVVYLVYFFPWRKVFGRKNR